MERAEEIFTMQLARAAGRQADRFLRTRGVPYADREDIKSAALLWCWEHRANYSLTTTLETWFMNSLRNAYQRLRRAAIPVADTSVDDIGTADTTFDATLHEASAQVLFESLEPLHREILSLKMQGFTYRELVQQGYAKRDIDNANRRVQQMSYFLPERSAIRGNGLTPPATNPDDHTYHPTDIDRELAQLDFAPPAGVDCPPCWRCMYFEGFMPGEHISIRLEIAEPELSEAVRETEARKIDIAARIRAGTIGFTGEGRHD